jgi:iron complex transport system substrate-binding protein
MFCLETAGGINIANDAVPRSNSNIAGYTKERILQHADIIDVFLAQRGRMNPVTVEMIKEEPGFGAIKAVRNDRVYLVDEKLVSRPTPKLIEGMYLIHRLLYPKNFP